MLILLLLAPILASSCDVLEDVSSSAPPAWVTDSAPEKGQFIVQCREPVASRPDDPIMAPGVPGGAHNHEFYGNKSIRADSTAASLAGQATGCDHDHKGAEKGDTASYWHPTLYASGKRLPAPKSTFYYTNRGNRRVHRAFPAGLKIIAGNAKASAPQGTNIIYWGCGSGTSLSKVERPPQCPRGTDLQLHVIFPDCWNGRDLDAPDHKSHMAYSSRSDGGYRCPSTHPWSMPTLIMRITWTDSTPAPATLSISSGPIDGMHADFFNTWNQARLEQLVTECVVGERDCDYDDVAALPFPSGGPTTSTPQPTTPTATTDPTPPTTAPPTTAPPPTHPSPPTPVPPPPTSEPEPTVPLGADVIPGGDFETTLDGWKGADGSALDRSPDSHTGRLAARVTRTDQGSGHARLMDDPATVATVSGTCSATAWVKGPGGRTGKIRLREYHSSGRSGSASAEVVLGSGWQRLDVELPGTDRGTLALDVYLQDAATGESVLIDDVSVRCR